ncbi:MAG TPA: HAMP domain-containing sensor histidine kinase [Terriglobales bacterium]|jgi:signal transduction histidine kinase|nr:HAMP domain-containing sensor histidine kinase [Terriglobales bacterium]
MHDHRRSTAAWRISIWTTLAFAVGTAIAFFIVYSFVAKGVRDHIDAWLSGEAEVLARVSADTPRGDVYDRIVEEVAELATQEVPKETNSRGQQLNSVFFLQVDPNGSDPLWVGGGSKERFVEAIRNANFVPGVPQSLKITGEPASYRVVLRDQALGSRVYLGLSERGATHTLEQLTRRFIAVWAGVAIFGFLISYASTRRTLLRIESITEAASRFGSEDMSERLPEPANSDEISRLARTFNHMLDRIQSSVNQLRAVTDAVAHDLKSPVTSIRGTLEAALSHGDENKLRDSVGQAIEGLDGVSQILNTTLDLAEAEAGALKIDRRPFDLSEALRQLIDLYQPAMAERHHELSADISDHVMVDADATLINRTISNLLENELVHVPGPCKVRVSLRSQEGSAELIVKDDGPGFPSDIGARAFERFVKGKHSPGHGLGLAFVDAVVQAHGGRIRISDGSEGGAVIRLSLPLSVVQPTVAAESRS